MKALAQRAAEQSLAADGAITYLSGNLIPPSFECRSRGATEGQRWLLTPMHVEFEYTREDLIDATQRFLARSKVVRSWKTNGLLWAAILTWLLVFTFFYRTPVKGALIGLVGAAVCALIFPAYHKRATEKRLRRLHEEILGNETSLRCGVEITPDGFTVTQRNHTAKYDWPSVAEIAETNDSVDIFTRDGGGVIVRNRAFESGADRTKFVELAKNFCSQACLSFSGKRVSTASTSVPGFTPNPMNDKVILVKGWNETEIQNIISDFTETYKDDGYQPYTIEAQKKEENLFRLSFPKDIHPMLYTFLVNYLAYPFDLVFKNRSVIVGGKTTLSAEFEGVDSSLVGTKAVLYVPQDDQDHDVVYMQTESGINLANSFTEIKWRKVNDARLSSEVRNFIRGI